MEYANFKFGIDNLKFYDKSKVEIKSFIPEGKTKPIRFFRKKGFGQWDKEAKIISRSGFTMFRDPFEIEAWNQILIDEANKYGTLVDENKQKALTKSISGTDVIKETIMSVAKIIDQGLIWVARSQMVCHKDSLVYGEIDEIWYHEKTDTYFVGDTKTSSSVDKMSYWYQLGIYIEILRSLNPDKKISPLGLIDWVKIKSHKWVYNKDFIESEWSTWKDKKVTPQDDVYNAKWKGKLEIETPEITNKIVKKNLEDSKILNQVKKDIAFINDFNISSVDLFREKLIIDEKAILKNKELQESYDSLKKGILNN